MNPKFYTQLVLSFVFLIVSVITPFYFEQILYFLVGSLGSGWVAGTITVRLISILFFALVVRILIAIKWPHRKIKFIWVFLIALLPGFGISFIEPIYNIDYGMLNDDLKLENMNLIEEEIQTTFMKEGKHKVVAFFTPSCDHCQRTSTKIGINQQAGQKIPVFAFFPKSEEGMGKFISTFKGGQFKSYEIQSDSLFVNLSGGVFPSVFLIDSNGKTLKHWTGEDLNYTALDYLKSIEQ